MSLSEVNCGVSLGSEFQGPGYLCSYNSLIYLQTSQLNIQVQQDPKCWMMDLGFPCGAEGDTSVAEWQYDLFSLSTLSPHTSKVGKS